MMAFLSGGMGEPEPPDPYDPCADCYRVLSAMSVAPPPDAEGIAFEHCLMAPCWRELMAERNWTAGLAEELPL